MAADLGVYSLECSRKRILTRKSYSGHESRMHMMSGASRHWPLLVIELARDMSSDPNTTI